MLQLVLVLMMVEAFLFLPGVLPAILTRVSDPNAPTSFWLLPAWFLGLSLRFGGPPMDACTAQRRSAWRRAASPS
ncbi:MAG: hypothetical protein R2712_23050 [Vicinamibacterales bacterium]